MGHFILGRKGRMTQVFTEEGVCIPVTILEAGPCKVTLVKTNADGLQEIIVKKGTEITAYELTGDTLGGDGQRLGTAYRLANGQIIYVPD